MWNRRCGVEVSYLNVKIGTTEFQKGLKEDNDNVIGLGMVNAEENGTRSEMRWWAGEKCEVFVV